MNCRNTAIPQYRVRSAFTLIELIIIIVVLLALAALMTPMFIYARGERVRQNCMASLAEIGKAVTLYAYDSDDTLPMAHYDSVDKVHHSAFFVLGSAGSRPLIWADLVRTYVPGFGEFTCSVDNLHVPKLGQKQAQPLSFALNYYIYEQPGVKRETLDGGGLSEISGSSSKLLLTEAAAKAGLELMRPDEWQAPDHSVIWERHVGAANWTYVDLHAEKHSPPSDWMLSRRSRDWKNPRVAATFPYPQWFPWLKSTSQKW